MYPEHLIRISVLYFIMIIVIFSFTELVLLTIHCIVIVPNDRKGDKKVDNKSKDNEHKTQSINHCCVESETVDKFLGVRRRHIIFLLYFFYGFGYF